MPPVKRKTKSLSQPNSGLELARRRVDAGIVERLEALLEDAKAGRIVGAVAALHYGGREYTFVGSGSLCDDPRLGLHAIATLARKLLP